MTTTDQTTSERQPDQVERCECDHCAPLRVDNHGLRQARNVASRRAAIATEQAHHAAEDVVRMRGLLANEMAARKVAEAKRDDLDAELYAAKRDKLSATQHVETLQAQLADARQRTECLHNDLTDVLRQRSWWRRLIDRIGGAR